MYERRKLLKTKTYSIIYQKDSITKKFECSVYSLEKNIKKFISEDIKVMCIIAHNVDENKQEKDKFYKNKCSCFYRKFKQEKITEDEFIKIKQILKQLRDESTTKEEFENKFLNYLNKKNTNNIPSYSVSG